MYTRVDNGGNPWDGTARYKKVKTPENVRIEMEKLAGLETKEAIGQYGQNVYLNLNALIKSSGGDVLATRRPDLISKNWIVK